jgi:phage gpG-like protein
MSIAINVSIEDQVSPLLQRLRAKMSDFTPAMRSVGVGLAALTLRAFDDPSLRPSAWPAKKDQSTATLRKTGLLWRSPRVIAATNNSVAIGSDRPYAAIHQLGGVKRPMPARPFFPVQPDGTPTDPARKTIRDVLVAYLNLR